MNTNELAIHVPLWGMIAVPALVTLIIGIYFFKKLSFAIKFWSLAVIWYLGAAIYTRYLFLHEWFINTGGNPPPSEKAICYWIVSPVSIPLKLIYDLATYGFSLIDVYLK